MWAPQPINQQTMNLGLSKYYIIICNKNHNIPTYNQSSPHPRNEWCERPQTVHSSLLGLVHPRQGNQGQEEDDRQYDNRFCAASNVCWFRKVVINHSVVNGICAIATGAQQGVAGLARFSNLAVVPLCTCVYKKKTLIQLYFFFVFDANQFCRRAIPQHHVADLCSRCCSAWACSCVGCLTFQQHATC